MHDGVAACAPAGPPAPSLAELIDRAAASHAAIRGALARLTAQRPALTGRDGCATPALLDCLDEIEACLTTHLAKADRIVLPYLRRLAAGVAQPAPFASLATSFGVLRLEHGRGGRAATRAVALAAELTCTSAACRATADAAAALRTTLAQHCDLEEHLLFPHALARELGLRVPPC